MSLIRRTAQRLLAAFAVTVLMMAGAQAQTSQLTLYFFDTGTPVNGMEILVDDELVAVSNPYGVAELQLEPGIHFVELRYQDAVVHEQQILAVQDEISQWIIDITGGGTAIYDEESSSPEIAAAVALIFSPSACTNCQEPRAFDP